ncbi:MAG: hypothetical protein GX477_10215 [Clostridiaceae bacterium]|nr:hypothetical protein [Clostridiaceae bacterium]
MGRSFSGKQAADVETARETFIPLIAAGVPKRTDRESRKLSVQANLHDHHLIDGMSDKRLRT